MEERLRKIEKKLEETVTDSEKIKEYVLGSVKIQLEEWLHDTLTISCITEEIERRYKRTRNDMAEYTKDHKKLEKEIENSKEHINENFTDICKIKNFLQDLVLDIKLKAYHGDLQRLERIVDEKSTWEFAYGLENYTKKLAKIEDLKETQNSLQGFKEQVKEQYFLRDEAKVSLKTMQKKLKNLMSEHTTKEETRTLISKVYAKLSENDEKLEEFRKNDLTRVDDYKKGILKLRADFSDNVKQFQFERLQKDLATKATKQELENFLGEHIPKIAEFNKEFLKIKSILDHQDKAMIRLDEIILEKASKLDFILLKDSLSDLSESFHINQMKQLSLTSLNQQKQLDTLTKNFNDFKADFENPNKLSLESEIMLIKMNLNEIENKLSYKAELSEVLEKFEDKASWDDFSHLAESIESVHLQTKLLASQFSVMMPKPQSRAASQSKIMKKLIDMVMVSRPTLEDTPTSHMKTFTKFPPTPDYFRSRVGTPKKKFFCSAAPV